MSREAQVRITPGLYCRWLSRIAKRRCAGDTCLKMPECLVPSDAASRASCLAKTKNVLFTKQRTQLCAPTSDFDWMLKALQHACHAAPVVRNSIPIQHHAYAACKRGQAACALSRLENNCNKLPSRRGRQQCCCSGSHVINLCNQMQQQDPTATKNTNHAAKA